MRRIIAILAATSLLVVVGLVAAPAPRAEALSPIRAAQCWAIFGPSMWFLNGATSAGLRACLNGYAR